MTRFLLSAVLTVSLCSSVFAQQVYNVNFISANSNTPEPNIDIMADGTPWALEVAPYDYGQTNTFWDDWRAQGTNPARDLTDSTGDVNNGQINLSFEPATDQVRNFSQKPPEGGLTPVVDNYAFLTAPGFSGPPEEGLWILDGLEPGSTWDLYFISQGDRVGQGGTFRMFEVDENGFEVIVDGELVPITDTLESDGTTPQATNLVTSADFDADNDVDGADYLIWQRGFGLTGQTDNTNGNTNPGEGGGLDDVVDGGDLGRWADVYGDIVVPAQYEEGTNYVVFEDVLVGPSGVLIGGWDDNNTTNFAILNGAQFVKTASAPAVSASIAVPEPSSLVCMLLGGAMLLGRRRNS